MAVLDGVESQRQMLEGNIQKLQASIHHWRAWDAEYEALKEELAAQETPLTAPDVASLHERIGGDLVNEKEIRDLLDIQHGGRDVDQVVNRVEKRQEYVQQNIATLTKQIQAVRLQLGEDSQDPVPLNHSYGLPISDIVEELDEDDNVISSKIVQPEQSTAALAQSLRKAGLSTNAELMEVDSSTVTPIANETRSTPSTPSIKAQADQSPKLRKKSVTFAPKAEEINAAGDSIERDTKQSLQGQPSLLNGSFAAEDRVFELNDDDEIVSGPPVIPNDESPDDARLRREMLQYSLNEVGSVVAELDLEEGASDDDLDSLHDSDDEIGEHSQQSDLSEDEDEHGRSLGPGVSAGYRKEMLKLERQLKARMIENLGPNPDLGEQGQSNQLAAGTDKIEQTPEFKEDEVMRDSVFERPSSGAASQPSTEDDFDLASQRQELSSSYYAARNKIIRQQGGFKSTDEDEEGPWMEEKDGKVKKVSRFKAARMRQD